MGTRRARASLLLGWLGSAFKWFGLLPRRSFTTLRPCRSNFIFLDLAMDISRSRS
ncbi:hypothetical protein BGY98DRAFT_1002687, partial [Russula aff. rugulosa BPL654]